MSGCEPTVDTQSHWHNGAKKQVQLHASNQYGMEAHAMFVYKSAQFSVAVKSTPEILFVSMIANGDARPRKLGVVAVRKSASGVLTFVNGQESRRFASGKDAVKAVIAALQKLEAEMQPDCDGPEWSHDDNTWFPCPQHDLHCPKDINR